MRSIGICARARSSSGISKRGSRSRRARYTFSGVFRRMKGHSLHAQLASGGAGIKILLGARLCIWCKMPALGHDDELARIVVLDEAQERGGRADEIRLIEQRLFAFRVRDHFCVRVRHADLLQLAQAERLVDDAAALPEH